MKMCLFELTKHCISFLEAVFSLDLSRQFLLGEMSLFKLVVAKSEFEQSCILVWIFSCSVEKEHY